MNSKAKKIIFVSVGVMFVCAVVGGAVAIAKRDKKQPLSPTPEHVHTEIADNAVSPTCTETGLTEGKHCSVCDEVIVEQKTVPVIPHNYVNGVCAMCDMDDPSATLDINAFYLLGEMNGWKWTSDRYKFYSVATDISNVTSQYKLTITLDSGTQVKIWKGNDDWSYNNYESDWEYATRGDNLTITQSGTYNFYLKFYNGGGNSVYVEKIN